VSLLGASILSPSSHESESPAKDPTFGLLIGVLSPMTFIGRVRINTGLETTSSVAIERRRVNMDSRAQNGADSVA
jgi:hypothetical protein